MDDTTKSASRDHDKFISGKEIKSYLQVSTTTLHRWSNEDRIRTIRTPHGTRKYSLHDVQTLLSRSDSSLEKTKICYCRVSSRKQIDDLERQQSFFRQEYPHHKLVTDIGSGINWQRKGLKTILEQAMSGHLSEVVVAHRDRLCRFAFELIQWILQTHGVKLVVLDQTTNQSSDTELADDILSIIHVYSCRQMGKRRYKTTKDPNLSLSNTEENDTDMDVQ